MATRDRWWPEVLPAALSVLAAVELAAYLLFGPVTTTPTGESAGALAAGNAFLAGLTVVVVVAAAAGTVAAVREWRQGVWLAAAALALVGVAGVAVGPQILAVALLLVVGALLGEAAADGTGPRRDGIASRRDGSEPAPGNRAVGDHAVEDVTVEPPPPERDVPPAVDQHPPPDRLGTPPEESDVEEGTAGEDDGAEEGGVESGETVESRTGEAGVREGRNEGATGVVDEGAGPWPGDTLGWEPDGPEREVVIAGLLLVPLSALLGVSVLTTPVAKPVVAATAVVVFAGAGAAVVAAARG